MKEKRKKKSIDEMHESVQMANAVASQEQEVGRRVLLGGCLGPVV